MDAPGALQLTSTGTNFWWLARKSRDTKKGDERDGNPEVAAALTQVATKLETAAIPQRWRSYNHYRYWSGRDALSQYAYGMARRPTSMYTYYAGFEFTPLQYSVIRGGGDIYVNRLLAHRVFLTFIPERGNQQQRQLSQDIEAWIEGGFEELGFWEAFKQMGLDALIYGTGWLKWHIGSNKKITVSNVHPDELLWTNPDDRNPQSAIQRVWASKEDTLARWGTNPAARRAIIDAQTAFPAFWFGQGILNTDDVIPLLEGWRLPQVDGKPGRHVLVVGNYTLLDEEYTDPELPFIPMHLYELPSSIQGQGIPEMVLGLAEEINNRLLAMQESDTRASAGKWLVNENSNVNEQALNDAIAVVVKWGGPPGHEPKYVTHPSISSDQIDHLNLEIDLAMRQMHISAQAVQGEIPKAISAAIAMEKYVQIEDSNFTEIIGRLEEAVKKSAYHMIRLGKRAKPDFRLPGRTSRLIKWDDVKILEGERTPIGLRAFSTGRLSQTVAGRTQVLDSLLAKASITRTTYNKYLQVPDTDGLLDYLNAPQESVDRQLDEMWRTGKYQPPLPFIDKDYAKAQAEARYCVEFNLGTEDEILDLFLMYRAAILDLIEQESTPDAPPPAGQSFGGQLPASVVPTPDTPSGLPAPAVPVPATV